MGKITGDKINSAEVAKKLVLTGKLQDLEAQEFAKKESEAQSDGRAGTASTDASKADDGMVAAPFKSERERKLFELKLKMNQGRTANSKAVLEEKKRHEDPEYEKKRAAAAWKEREKEMKKAAGEDVDDEPEDEKQEG